MEEPVLRQLSEGLPELLGLLREDGFEAGTDQYLLALEYLTHQLFQSVDSPRQAIEAALAGIFCTSPSEQRRFGDHFGTWWPIGELEKPSDNILPTTPWWRYYLTLGERVDLVILVLLLVLGVGVGYYFYDQEIIGPDTSVGSTEVDPVTKKIPPTEAKSASQIDFDFSGRAARPIPLPVAGFLPWWAPALTLLWLIPALVYAYIVLRSLGYRYLVLRRDRRGDPDRSVDEQLTLTVPTPLLFDHPDLVGFWRDLRRFHWRASPKLDVAATLNRVLKNGGYLDPCYRRRAVPPAYVALIEQQHSEDHAAGYAREFVAAMRREHLQVVELHHRGDPHHARYRNTPGVRANIHELDSLFPDHDLFILGHGRALADAPRQRLATWTVRLHAWPRKWLLSPNPLWPRTGIVRGAG